MTVTTSRRSRLPLGVLVVVVIALMRSVTIIAELADLDPSGPLGFLSKSGPLPDFAPGSDVEIIARGVLVGLLIASLLVIVGLLFRRRWAWVLSIISAGVILALDIGWWYAGTPRDLSMFLNVIAVFYLNQRDVRVALRGTPPEPRGTPPELREDRAEP